MINILYFYILLAAAGSLSAVIVILCAILRRKARSLKSRSERMETAEEKGQASARRDMADELSTKMRTPLSLIKMPVEKMLREDNCTDSSKEDLIIIKNNVDKLLELTKLYDGALKKNSSSHPEATEDNTVTRCDSAMDDSEAADTPEVQSGQTDSSKQTILIVEDEADMRKYLTEELAPLYNVCQASNGQEAVDIIKKTKTDLVVSDIMMPLMDGCELCNFIKTNVEYSHIPVLLLTAVVGVETRIETLESGADGYIEKPFEMELLKANIANLFRNKEISYRQFADSPLSHFSTVTPNKVETAFMEKLHSAVMKHLADQELGIEMLTDILGTSKTTLYRKIKTNTGLNTNEYIRICRLKKAADMLSSQEYRINEVAYLTGFSSPSYFATSFQKQFNISPSAFVKNLRG